MPADRDAFAVDADSPAERLALAAEILSGGRGVVLLEGVVALRSARTHLLCEVVDPAPSERRCENEFGVLVENARRMLEASKLRSFLPDLPQTWRVVEDNGTDLVELWRAP